jgi:hypothetical protein
MPIVMMEENGDEMCHLEKNKVVERGPRSEAFVID